MTTQETIGQSQSGASLPPRTGSDETKFCTDCKWMAKTSDGKYDICKRPGKGIRNLVNGEMRYPLCADEREGLCLGPFTLFMTIGCGEKAKYFQPNAELCHRTAKT